MKAQQKEAPPVQRKLCLASLAVGLALTGIAGTAMMIDLSNNHAFGAKISPELGMVMVLAAIALTALPAAAALLGRWDWRLKYGTAFAVLLTVLAAVSAYSEKQGAEILARQGAGDAYRQAQINAEAARKEIAEARAEAAAISETASVEDLRSLVAHHRGMAQKEIGDRGGRGKLAKAHEEAEAAALARIPAARAKAAAIDHAAAAQARLGGAQEGTKAGPAEVSMLATVIAGRTGQAPEDIARAIALGTTLASIAVTLIMALLAEQAVKLLMTGFGMSSIGGEVKDEQKPAQTPAPEAQPKRLPKVLTADERIDWFVGERIRYGIAGKFLTPTELYDLFQAWWMSHSPTVPVPTMRALSNRMKELGHSSIRKGGIRIYADMAIAA